MGNTKFKIKQVATGGTTGSQRFTSDAEMDLKAAITVVDTKDAAVVTQLTDSAPIDGNTFNKLNNKILAIQALLNGDDINLDSIKELADAIKADEGTIAALTTAKINITDIYNALDSVVAGKVLDSRQGKVLNDAIGVVSAALATFIARTDNPNAVTKAQVGLGNVDNTSDAAKPISTAQAAGLAPLVAGQVPFANLSITLALNTTLTAWTNTGAFAVVSMATPRDSNGVITIANIVWPDGSTGVFTTDTASINFPGAIDAYHITYIPATGSTKTITQSLLTRDSNGAVIAQPVLTII
jgi:hypothetical protein